MGFKISRKPFRIGKSQAVTLPAGWCQYYGKRVNRVTILGSSLLVIAPEGLENAARAFIEQFERQGSPK